MSVARARVEAVADNSWLYAHEKEDIRALLAREDVDSDALAMAAWQYEGRIEERRAAWERSQ